MSNQATPVNVTILDKEYKIACPSGEQAALIASAEYLDSKMREVRDSGNIIGAERIAVITALNIAHELLNSSQSSEDIEEGIPPRLKKLEMKISEALEQARQMEI